VPSEREPGFDTWDSTDDAPRGGGGIWVTPSLDAEKGLLYDDSLRHGRPQRPRSVSSGASDVIDSVPKLGYMAIMAKQATREKLIEHKQYITRHGADMPEVKDWRWPAPRA
jgi:hypothetical protein